MTRDAFAIDGKIAPPEARYDLVVVGAGPAGAAAALAGARAGQMVLLVDENPLAPELMRTDVPLFYGMRMTAAIERPDRLIETLLGANPDLEAAFEAGVDVRLGVTAWGLYVPQAGLAALPEAMLGLADGERSWFVGYDRLVVAAGARDLALSFPGWDQPGVMGANALHALLIRYAAFNGSRVLILGSGDLAMETALLAWRQGVSVAGIVEVRGAVQAMLPPDLAAAGIPVFTDTVLLRAEGDAGGVTSAVLSNGEVLACDTICLAIGLVPAVELVASAGARLEFDALRGGHVPLLTDEGRTSLAGVYAIGDCAGVSCAGDSLQYRADWSAALGRVAPADTIVCQCEAVTRADLLGVQPPRYLGTRSAAMVARGLDSLLADGPADQDQVKRLTRACMGVCQARRCREQVSLLLAEQSGLAPEAAPFTGYRAPVRPLPLAILADWAEPGHVQAGWDVWFGVPEQWIPYADIGTDREAAHIAALGGNMHL